MQIAVISDLHLGRGDKADLFGHDDTEFLGFLDHLERNFERIVLLGDVYETLTGPNPLAQVRELEAVKAAHPELHQRFQGDRYTYIHGNHDLLTANVDAAPSSLALKVDGQKILFTHGHGYDWLGRHARWVSEWCVWFSAWICRVGMRKLYKALEAMDLWLRGAQVDPTKCSFQRWAVGVAERHDADIIVTGHTHCGVAAEHGDRLFLNSGSCSNGRFSFAALDTAAGSYTVETAY